MGWSAWIPLGQPSGGFTGKPATICRNADVTNVYVRGNDNALWQRAYSQEIGTTGFATTTAGTLASAPSLGSMGPDHEHVFAANRRQRLAEVLDWPGGVERLVQHRGTRGRVHRRNGDRPRNNGVCNVYVRGNDNALWQRAYWAGTWHDWGRHNDGAVLASEPSLGSMGPDHEHVFVRGTDGNVWQKYWTGAAGWSGWFNIGAPAGGFTGGPVTISRNSQACNVYVRGNDNALWQRPYYNNQWHDWARHNDGGTLASEPALSHRGPDHEQVLVRGTDAQVWHKWWVPRLPAIDVNLIYVGRENYSNAQLAQPSIGRGDTTHLFTGRLERRNDPELPDQRRRRGNLEIIDSLAEAQQLTVDWTVPNSALDASSSGQ